MIKHTMAAILLSSCSIAFSFPTTVKLTANAEWLPEGSGVLLSTNKGYIHIYSDLMSKVGGAKKGECYIFETESESVITLHKRKYPSLKELESQTEAISYKKITCQNQ